MHEKSPITTGAGGDDIEHSVRGEGKRVAKWARMWRSIILSSLGKTLFPYAQFIRNLRLGDLQELLEEGKFRNNSKITRSGLMILGSTTDLTDIQQYVLCW